jgi:hypothetical protein
MSEALDMIKEDKARALLGQLALEVGSWRSPVRMGLDPTHRKLGESPDGPVAIYQRVQRITQGGLYLEAPLGTVASKA